MGYLGTMARSGSDHLRRDLDLLRLLVSYTLTASPQIARSGLQQLLSRSRSGA